MSPQKPFVAGTKDNFCLIGVHKHKQRSLGCHPLIEASEWVKWQPPSTLLVPGWPCRVRHLAISLCPPTPHHPDTIPLAALSEALCYWLVLAPRSLHVIGSKRDAGHKLDSEGRWIVGGTGKENAEESQHEIYSLWLVFSMYTDDSAHCTLGCWDYSLPAPPCPSFPPQRFVSSSLSSERDFLGRKFARTKNGAD